MAVIKGVHHVQISIPRGAEEAGRAFYCGVLGLPEIEKPEALQGRGGFWLQVGDRQVHVGTEDGVTRQATKAHIAYEVDDIAAWQAAIHALDLPMAESVEIPGHQRFEFRDPFGNRVELTQVISTPEKEGKSTADEQ
jgi:catechol 2,3-dioxygenase-like lactoylglutathione lyase family enzyme